MPVIVRREKGQAWLRVAVTFAVALAVYVAQMPSPFFAAVPWVLLSYCTLAAVFAAAIRHVAHSPWWRRVAVNAADTAVITYVMIGSGEAGMPLFVLFLWVTLGNGFRFGTAALAVSAVLSTLGFAAVVLVTPAWREHNAFLVGAALVLVLLPAAASTLIRRMNDKASKRNVSPLPMAHVVQPKAIALLNWVAGKRLVKQAALAQQSYADNLIAREAGQALLRAVVTLAATVLVAVMSWPLDFAHGVPTWLALGIGYIAASVLILRHIARSGTPSPFRRYLGNVGDVAAISYGIFAAGEAGIPLFALYLWVTFGNGFRFGTKAIIVSAALSVVAFAIVVAFSEVWQRHPFLAVSVFVALAVLPLYTAHLLQMLNSALARAEQANNVKSEFLARMSHELRTPLNGIVGSVELLRASRRLTGEERALLDVIHESVKVSLGQVSNVLDFSKLEAGRLQLDYKPADLHALVHGTIGLVGPAAKQKGLRVVVRIAPDVPFDVVTDAHHLRAVLLNLLSNAVKFTERGAVWVDIVKRAHEGQTALLRCEVRDTGIGIAPEAIDRIFESFTQEDVNTTRRYGGTGLGTTIAKELVELMGGTIGVESIKDRGTIFWFEMPFHIQAAGEPRSFAQARAVLLSDDVATIERYRAYIGDGLIRVVVPDEAEVALARAFRLGNALHAVFIDEAKAMIAGAHRCGRLCEQALGFNVPVVLIADRPPDAQLLRECGYAAVLPRAVGEDALFSTLHASPHWNAHVQANVTALGRPVATGPARSGNAGRMRVLVADDNQTNRMIVSRMLEQAGYLPETVESGDRALECLLAGGYRIAVLDMHMPGLDGTEVVRQYRAARPRSPLPVIMLTANVSMAAQQASAEAGADAYLAKPVTTAQLVTEVKRLLDSTEVEIVSWDALVRARRGEPQESLREVLDVSVLAELDRIYSNPQELDLLTQEYAREADKIIVRIQDYCRERKHPAFCDAVHALKSSAANVGAVRLVDVCRKAEATTVVEFIRDRDKHLAALRDAFTESVKALKNLTGASAEAPVPPRI